MDYQWEPRCSFDERKDLTMKIFTMLLFCASLLLEGCYTSRTISQDEEGKREIEQNEDIQVRMKDGRVIIVELFHYICVDEFATFVYGSGMRIDNETHGSFEFVGKIVPVACDSNSKNFSNRWGSAGKRRFDFYLSDGSVVQFARGDFVTVDSSQGTGLWICRGEELSTGRHYNNMRIPFDSIENAKVHHFSVGLTTMCVGAAGAGAVLLGELLIALALSTGSHD